MLRDERDPQYSLISSAPGNITPGSLQKRFDMQRNQAGAMRGALQQMGPPQDPTTTVSHRNVAPGVDDVSVAAPPRARGITDSGRNVIAGSLQKKYEMLKETAKVDLSALTGTMGKLMAPPGSNGQNLIGQRQGGGKEGHLWGWQSRRTDDGGMENFKEMTPLGRAMPSLEQFLDVDTSPTPTGDYRQGRSIEERLADNQTRLSLNYRAGFGDEAFDVPTPLANEGSLRAMKAIGAGGLL